MPTLNRQAFAAPALLAPLLAISACSGGGSTEAPGSSNSGASDGTTDTVTDTSKPLPTAGVLAGDTQLLLVSGFEDDVSIIADTADEQRSYLRGSDDNYASKNDWLADIDNSPLNYVGIFRIWYEAGGPSQRHAQIVDDPTDPQNQVLAFEIEQGHIDVDGDTNNTKGRVQSALADSGQLSEIYTKVRFYLHPDLQALTSLPEAITWFTLQEYWNNLPDRPNPFRISLNLQKLAGENQNLYLGVHGQTREEDDSGNLRWVDQWTADSSTGSSSSFTVPTGQWLTLETYYKEGDESTGRFIVTVTDQNNVQHTIADISDATYHNINDIAPDGVSHFNPMKLYTSGDLIRQMTEDNKRVAVYWDDFELWVNGTEE